MESSEFSRNMQNEHLGVNKIGKNIRKSPLHQPNFSNTARQQQQQSQVYNVNKNDFRNIVQQLTGSPSQDQLLRPPNNQPKSPSMRLQRIRPPPLTPPVNRPQLPIRPPPQPVIPPVPPSNIVRAPQYGQPSPKIESPISAYMRYLQNSIVDSNPRPNNPQPQQQQPLLTSPQMNGPPPLLPSPTSQFLLPSPSSFLNLTSPRSPYPLLSPGNHVPPPLTPNFSFSSMGQSGIFGPGLQHPPSPGFPPLSPSGFFAISSPRWRNY